MSANQEQVANAIIRVLRDPCASGTHSQLVMLGDTGLKRAKEMVLDLLAEIELAESHRDIRNLFVSGGE